MKRLILIFFALCAVSSFAATAQKITVTGVVKDETGQTVIGAGVIDKNNPQNGTVTDIDGKYKITISKDGVIEFSYLSYKSKLETVNGRKTIDVTLEPDNAVLETAVAIGYGTSKKGDLTGAVSVLKMDDIQETPAVSAAQLLQGRVAGADIVSGDGSADSKPSIQIRGSRSVSAGNEPLIVVDGVVDAVSSLEDINPGDIVSISILKDVSSTAIYGSRGANGVILVTTSHKLDKDQKFKVMFKSMTGVSHIAGELDTMNATEYATYQNMYRNRAGNLSSTPSVPGSGWAYPDPSVYGEGTDWVKKVTQLGIFDNQYIQITGNTGKTNYYAGAGFNYTRGIVIGQETKRYTFRTSFDTTLAKWIKIGLKANFVYFDIRRSAAQISGTSSTAAIYLSPLLNENSDWNKTSADDQLGSVFNNPYKSAKNIKDNSDKWNLNLVPWVEFNFAKRFTLMSQFSFTRENDMHFYYSPSYMPVAASRQMGGTARRTVYDEQRFLSETTLTYKIKAARVHNIEALVGFTAAKNVKDNNSLTGNGYVNDNVTYYNMAGIVNTANLSPTSYNYQKTSMSVLGRINYNYKRRYYLTFTARADGASNFSESKKWGFFPAAAFRWSIMNEKWFHRAHWLNDLSLRVSAGRSGNDAISSYLSMATVSSSKGQWLFGDRYQLATLPDRLANSDLTWETTDAYNIGLNFSAWESRVNVEVEGYYSKTDNLLMNVRNSQVTGYNTYFANMGATRNMGVEFTLSTVNVKSKNFKWNSSLTISHNSQVVLDSGAGDEVVPTYMNPRNTTQYLYGYRTGYPVNALWGYQKAGVWHNQAEIDRNESTRTYISSAGNAIGRTKFVDVNSDGILDQKDVVYQGSSDPVVYGGFQNDFVLWRRLNVSLFFAYSFGGKIYNLSELWMASSSNNWNKYRYMLDAFDPVRNPDSNIAKVGWDDTNASDFQVHDASFIRLKTLTISYSFPIKKWSKFFKGFQVGVTGENLFLWKNYNGFDPDVSSSSTVRRLDNGAYPRPRTYTLNIHLSF